MTPRLLLPMAALVMATGCFVDRSGLVAIDGGTQACAMDGGCDDPRDVDGDGVLVGVDCDDGDPSVGRMAERACDGECAPGIERCVDGRWDPCDAPADCDCSNGETRSLDCVRCGTQAQRCVGGGWVNEGGCVEQGPCSPGDALPESEACGHCMSGTRQRARICGTSCAWGPASEWSACAGESGCAPDDLMTDTQVCGRCGSGTQMRERSCLDTCDWSDWSDFSACTGETGCVPGAVETENDACSGCTGGMRTRTRTCGATCAWDPWTDWSACSGGTPPCTGTDTDTDTQTCGDCGGGTRTRTRTCDAASCSWGPWSDWSGCGGDASCGTVFSGDYCPCRTHWLRGTCCPDGDWSGSGCSGCP